MTTLTRGQPDMTLVPNYALGGGTAATLAVFLLGLLLLIILRQPKPDLVLARFAAIGALAIGACGSVILIIGGLVGG